MHYEKIYSSHNNNSIYNICNVLWNRKTTPYFRKNNIKKNKNSNKNVFSA